jgi:hypothetical protein
MPERQPSYLAALRTPPGIGIWRLITLVYAFVVDRRSSSSFALHAARAQKMSLKIPLALVWYAAIWRRLKRVDVLSDIVSDSQAFVRSQASSHHSEIANVGIAKCLVLNFEHQV